MSIRTENKRNEMIVEQNANNPELDRLKQDWVAIPTLVLLPRHLAVAEELINATAQTLGLVSLIADEIDPARPALAGRLWEEVSADTRRLYGVVTRELDSDGATASWPEARVHEAMEIVKSGLMALSRLPQQSMSGMVQRHS